MKARSSVLVATLLVSVTESYRDGLRFAGGCGYLIHATAKGKPMDQHCERILRQIAFGYVLTPSGGMRKMYNHEMISLARGACDQLGMLTRTVRARIRSKPAAGRLMSKN
jgi:hypothetical protein